VPSQKKIHCVFHEGTRSSWRFALRRAMPSTFSSMLEKRGAFISSFTSQNPREPAEPRLSRMRRRFKRCVSGKVAMEYRLAGENEVPLVSCGDLMELYCASKQALCVPDRVPV
jgi:hypothetical protein